jgi:hypothetical protein
MVALMATIAILTVIKNLMPGAFRDCRDADRVLLTYLDAWDLTINEIRKMTRLSLGRTHRALIRLESLSLLESYQHGGRAGSHLRRRYVLTNLGREAVFDLERAKLDEAHDGQYNG